MPIPEALQQIRDHYVDHYSEAIARIRHDHPTATPEVLIEPNRSSTPHPYRLWRVDLIYKVDGEAKIIEVNQSRYLDFAPTEIAVRELSILLHPMYWNGVELRATPIPAQWAPFEAWLREWLDPEDSRVPAGPVLGNVIHSVLAPAVTGGSWTTSIDFGSARPDAFWHLMTVLEESGIRSVEIGSFSMIEETPHEQGDGPA
jgi:hypothetical protein